MVKKYKIVPNKKQLKTLKQGWAQLQKDYDDFWGLVCATEEWMSKETGIKDLEFFMSPDDGSYCGIGNGDRTMGLIQREELE